MKNEILKLKRYIYIYETVYYSVSQNCLLYEYMQFRNLQVITLGVGQDSKLKLVRIGTLNIKNTH